MKPWNHRRPIADIRADLAARALLNLAETHCAHYRVELDAVLGDCREGTLPYVRAKLWGATRVATGYSMPQIGALYGFDKSSVHVGITKYCPESMGNGRGRTRARVVRTRPTVIGWIPADDVPAHGLMGDTRL